MFEKQTSEKLNLKGEEEFRYRLQDCNKSLLRKLGIEHRFKGVMSCGSSTFSEGVAILRSRGGRFYFTGVVTCGNGNCPVCSLGAMVKKRKELMQGIRKARRCGYGVYLVTYTFAHGMGDDLEDIQYRFGMAKQDMYRNGSFRRYIRELGYLGRMTDYEVQMCGRNGYHPHTHDLEIMDEGLDLDVVKRDYSKFWLDALEKNGLSGLEGVAVDVQGYEGVGNYISKMSAELSLWKFSKDSWGGGSMSPFQCLKMYYDTGNMYYGAWWADYLCSTKGKRMLGWSRGLKSILGVSCDSVNGADGDDICIVLDDSSDYSRVKSSVWREVLKLLNCGKSLDAMEILKRGGIGFYLHPDFKFEK